MKNFSLITKKQKYFIEKLIMDTTEYISTLDKSGVDVVLLSGSVARGDYYPGPLGGMVDLTVMHTENFSGSPEDIFGKDIEPEIPYHCIEYKKQGYQIAFHEFVGADIFKGLDEAKKYALLESRILFDRDEGFKEELSRIQAVSKKEISDKYSSALSYICYLLSDYKKDRWIRREAWSQLHQNLNSALEEALKCLYYKNGSYAPAQDRRLYYSYELDRLPHKYERLTEDLYRQEMGSESDYFRREKLFYEWMFSFLTGS